MAKRSLEEILEKINTLLPDNTTDDALSLLEDLTDTYSKDEEDWHQKYLDNDAEWRTKYRERFYSSPVEEPEDDLDDPRPHIVRSFEELFKEV